MSKDARNAWIALACTIATFVAGVAVGEAIFSAFGYEPGVIDAPLAPTLISALTAIAIIDLAPLAAWRLGRRAVRAGDASGKVPMVIGLVVALGVVVLNVLGAVAS